MATMTAAPGQLEPFLVHLPSAPLLLIGSCRFCLLGPVPPTSSSWPQLRQVDIDPMDSYFPGSRYLGVGAWSLSGPKGKECSPPGDMPAYLLMSSVFLSSASQALEWTSEPPGGLVTTQVAGPHTQASRVRPEHQNSDKLTGGTRVKDLISHFE